MCTHTKRYTINEQNSWKTMSILNYHKETKKCKWKKIKRTFLHTNFSFLYMKQFRSPRELVKKSVFWAVWFENYVFLSSRTRKYSSFSKIKFLKFFNKKPVFVPEDWKIWHFLCRFIVLINSFVWLKTVLEDRCRE